MVSFFMLEPVNMFALSTSQTLNRLAEIRLSIYPVFYPIYDSVSFHYASLLIALVFTLGVSRN